MDLIALSKYLLFKVVILCSRTFLCMVHVVVVNRKLNVTEHVIIIIINNLFFCLFYMMHVDIS